MYLTLLFNFVCLLPFYKLCIPLHSTVGVVKLNFKLSCLNFAKACFKMKIRANCLHEYYKLLKQSVGKKQLSQ